MIPSRRVPACTYFAPMGDHFILESKTVTPVECLHYVRFSIGGGLFGRGEDSGRRYQLEPEATQAALEPRTMDRLDSMDEINRDAIEPYLSSYQVSRRRLFGLGGLLGLLAAVSPASLRHASRLDALRAVQHCPELPPHAGCGH